METKPMYQEALIRSGYSYELKYEKVNIHDMNNNEGRRKRSRKRQILWFNPVFCKRVETNVGAQFLKILDTTIPRGHVLYKLFNRHTVKVSYRTLGNLAKTISTHNVKVLNEHERQLQQQQQQRVQQQPAAPLRTRLRRRLQQQDDVVGTPPPLRVTPPRPRMMLRMCLTRMMDRHLLLQRARLRLRQRPAPATAAPGRATAC